MESATLILLLLALISIFIFLIKFAAPKKKTTMNHKVPPTVSYSLPIFGHGIYICFYSRQFFKHCYSKYGDVFQIKIFSKLVTVVCNRDLVSEICSSSETQLSLYNHWQRTFVGMTNGLNVKTSTPIIRKATVKIGTRQMGYSVLPDAYEFMDRIEFQSQNSKDKIDLNLEISRFVIKATASALFGMEFIFIIYHNRSANCFYRRSFLVPEGSENEPVDAATLQKLFLDLLQKPFEQNKPLWDLSIVNHVQNTAIFLRMHHILADGYSIMNMLQNGLLEFEEGIQNVAKPSAETTNRNIFQKGLVWILYPFHYMYESIGTNEAYLDTASANTETRRQPDNPDKLDRKRRLLVQVSDSVPISYLKAIKNHYGVTFTSVLLSTFARSFKKILPKSYTASYVATYVVMPSPNHGDDLSNEMSSGTAYLTLTENSDEKHLKLCHQEYESIKSSTVPLGNSIMIKLMGGLPLPLYEGQAGTQTVIKAAIGNFPGPNACGNMKGRRLVDCFFSGGLYPGLDLDVSVLSYNDSIRFCILGDGEAVSQLQMQILTSGMVLHCKTLYEMSKNI